MAVAPRFFQVVNGLVAIFVGLLIIFGGLASGLLNFTTTPVYVPFLIVFAVIALFLLHPVVYNAVSFGNVFLAVLVGLGIAIAITRFVSVPIHQSPTGVMIVTWFVAFVTLLFVPVVYYHPERILPGGVIEPREFGVLGGLLFSSTGPVITYEPVVSLKTVPGGEGAAFASGTPGRTLKNSDQGSTGDLVSNVMGHGGGESTGPPMHTAPEENPDSGRGPVQTLEADGGKPCIPQAKIMDLRRRAASIYYSSVDDVSHTRAELVDELEGLICNANSEDRVTLNGLLSWVSSVRANDRS
jgi:hypothetical protein